ncbi:MAG: hypothetical protein ABIA04_13500 [Pseudomonadota bacterium]
MKFLKNNWILVLGIILSIIICLKTDPISRNQSHLVRMYLAIYSALCLIFYFIVRNKLLPFKEMLKKRSYLSNIFFALIIFGSIVGIFNYYQFDKKVFATVGDHSDVTYYYINSKYFNELGYYNLYPAILIADSELANKLNYIKKYRDLKTYKMVKTRHAFNNSSRIKAKFSDTRWKEFRKEINFLISKNIAGGWKYFFIDHGYNPPPTWTIVGGSLAKLVPVTKLKYITTVDLLLIILMFILIAKSFGLIPMFFSILFFICTFSGRWPILGQALLRFDWLVCLVSSVCFLKLNKHLSSGLLMMYSALNRIFPAIFFFPYFIKIIHGLIKDKKLCIKSKKFIIGSTISFVLLVGSSLIFLGPSAYIESQENIKLHASAESYSSHRVGLGDALLFRFETSRKEMNKNGGIDQKRKDLETIMPALKLLALFCLIFLAIYIIKSKLPVYSLIPLLIIPLFILTNPQINYYNLRLLLILWHFDNPKLIRNKLGLIILFAIEAITQLTHVLGYTRYTVTCTTSLGLLIYFIFIITNLSIDLIKNSKQKVSF